MGLTSDLLVVPNTSKQKGTLPRLEPECRGDFLKEICTLVFQLEDTVRLFGTLLLLDPIYFPKSEPCLLIGSVCQNGALLGTSF